LIIVGSNETITGTIIHGKLKNAILQETKLPVGTVVSGNGITINNMSNFTGLVSIPEKNSPASFSLSGGKTTELSLTEIKNKEEQSIADGVTIPKESPISGKSDGLKIVATVVGCNKSNNYGDDCVISDGSLSDVKLTKVIVEKLKSLHLHTPTTIASLADAQLKDISLKDGEMSFGKDPVLKGTILTSETKSPWTLQGKVDWTTKPLALGTTD
jgi:hypothetical protein